MTIIAYARVSTVDQSLDVQLEQLRNAGAEKIFSEQVSGAPGVARPQLDACLDYVRDGDTLLVTRLDRVARSIVDLRGVVDRLEAKKVIFQCLLQPIETRTSAGRLMLTMLGAFAEFELDIRRERQREGIEKAKAAGVYAKKKILVTPEAIAAAKARGLGASEIAREFRIARASVYRHSPPGLWG